nr:hypothetical protein [Entomospira nematocera]
MLLWSRMKGIITLGGSLMIALMVAIKSYRKGVQSGRKQTIQSIHKAEAQRHATQEDIHKMQQQAMQEVLEVDSSRVVDHFNGMFNATSQSPSSTPIRTTTTKSPDDTGH